MLDSAQVVELQKEMASEVVETSDAQNSSNIYTLRTSSVVPSVNIPLQKPNAITKQSPLPAGYVLHNGHICTVVKINNAVEYDPVCSELYVVALIRNKDGRGWGKVIEAKDPDGNIQRLEIPYNAEGNLCADRLADIGVSVKTKRKQQLAELVSNWEPIARSLRVDKGGWDADLKYFVLGNEVFGKVNGAELVMFEGLPGNHMFQSKGTLKEWQEHVGRICVGNSRLIFAVSMGLAGPLLKFGKEGGVGFHFFGKSSRGKTTLAKIAGSLVGGGAGGYLRTWRATDNGLEGVCLQHNDLLMVMDEVGQADDHTVSKSAYMIANGEQKARATKTGGVSEMKRWQVIMLSTGEPRISSKIAGTGQRIKAGQAVRFIDLSVEGGKDMGIVEELHEFASSKEFVESLESDCIQCYGMPVRELLKKMVLYDYDDISKSRENFIKAFEELCFPGGTTDTQASRVCVRFAEIGFAGEVGEVAKILPWPAGTARKAALRLFQEWLDERGEGAYEDRSILHALKNWFQTKAPNHMKYELSGGEGDNECQVSWGARGHNPLYGVVKNVSGEDCFCLFPGMLTMILTSEQITGIEKNTVIDVLKTSDLLAVSSDRKDDKVIIRNTQKINFNGSRQRMMVIKRSILDLEL